MVLAARADVGGSDFWGKLLSLKIVDLSNNLLEGGIPTSFTSLGNLTQLSLDNNNLSGQVPPTLKTKPNLYLSYSGNSLLCEAPQICEEHAPVFDLPPISSVGPPVHIKKGSSSNKTGMMIGMVCAGAVVALIIVAAAIVAGRRMRRRNPSPDPTAIPQTNSSGLSVQTPRKLLGNPDTQTSTTCTHSNAGESRIPDLPFTVKQYTPEQIREALAAGTRLKMDDESSFFLAQINTDAVIIKRISCRDEDDIFAFRKEVDVLSRIHHRNLLRFLGCCVRPGSEAIVFESTGYGTLYEALHGIVKKTNPLLWHERLDVCVGIASALYYLHTQVMPVVVHRNINTSNIVLDKKSQPKLANFSFSRSMVEKTGTCVGTLTEVKGTTGYVDPEYEQTGNLTSASDIFSLGVVLLEILTGRHAIVLCETTRRQIPLADWVRPLLEQDAIEKVLDPTLRPSSKTGLGSKGSLQADLEAAWAIADCAIRCCEPSGIHRPTIHEINNELERIRKAVRRGAPSAQKYSDSYASSPGSIHHSRSSVSANPASQDTVSEGRCSH
ncbi:hypothetical protein CBR_g52002 [Chara braunii]|uniref:non-specific serine/threonine protein kinase n=1 Tax=Chara braunii TaxID=69332 RepID=A0A388K6M3_CHABU|nr:hypothetical protein CBR_g52002 [Chara braunii]|eukprot:GBG65702.1 hypothetical protein CBR_g52002 [Chara braunii]